MFTLFLIVLSSFCLDYEGGIIEEGTKGQERKKGEIISQSVSLRIVSYLQQSSSPYFRNLSVLASLSETGSVY